MATNRISLIPDDQTAVDWNGILQKAAWLQPRTPGDWAMAGLSAFNGFFGGLGPGIATLAGYTLFRWSDNTPSMEGPAARVSAAAAPALVGAPKPLPAPVVAPASIEDSKPLPAPAGAPGPVKGPKSLPTPEIASLPPAEVLLPVKPLQSTTPFAATLPPPPIVRAATAEEGRLDRRGEDDPLDFGAAPLWNLGNTCFAAALAQTWLLSRENDLREKSERLGQKIKEMEQSGQDTAELKKKQEAARKLIQFIESNRAHVSDNGDRPDINLLTKALRTIAPSYEEEYRSYLIRSTKDFLGAIEPKHLPSAQERIEALQGSKRGSFFGRKPDAKTVQKELQRKIRLKEYLEEVSSQKKVDPYKVRQKLAELGELHLIYAPPQQDAQEMLQHLHAFIYEDLIKPLQIQTFAALNLAPGETLVSGDPGRYPFKPESYVGVTFLYPEAQFDESTHSFLVAPGSSFSALLPKGFCGEGETAECKVRTESGDATKNVPIAHMRSLIETAPSQFVFCLNRFRVMQSFNERTGQFEVTSYKVQGAISGIDEIMEIPGDYFADGAGAVYRLDAIIDHDGGTLASSGHYTAAVRKFNPATPRNSRFVFCNDSAISGLSREGFLQLAGLSGYILILNRIY